MKIRINGAGCCLLDYLHTDADFSSPAFKSYESQKPGDGGLVPGQLVFAEDLAAFAGEEEDRILNDLTGGKKPDTVNLGGPGVVAMVHASQMLPQAECRFYGVDNESFAPLRAFVDAFPLKYERLESPGAIPSTTVLSDASYADGAGERTFINRLGAAASFDPSQLPEDFFSGDINLFGGTALVPRLHDELAEMCRRSKKGGALTVVGTVYDFRNQSAAPLNPWPLGRPGKEAYAWTDLLICDAEEALRLAGCESLEASIAFFETSGVNAFIITRGADDFYIFAREDSPFKDCPGRWLPVSPYVDNLLAAHPEKRGDTTGCGDNFVGGVITALAGELQKKAKIDLPVLAAEGASAGGVALLSRGGCYAEDYTGQKEEQVAPVRKDYLKNTLGLSDRDLERRAL